MLLRNHHQAVVADEVRAVYKLSSLELQIIDTHTSGCRSTCDIVVVPSITGGGITSSFTGGGSEALSSAES
jgi:hypothetical protein